MSWQIRIRLGASESTQLKAVVATLSEAEVIATLSPSGTVVVTQPVERIADPYLGAGLVTFSGLQPWTVYHYSITQGNETIEGQFRTAPAVGQAVDYAWAFATCDHPLRPDVRRPYRWIKAIAEAQETTCPMLFMATIDGVSYVDGTTFDDSAGSGLVISVPAQETDPPDGEVYAAAWAEYLGLVHVSGKWRYAERQWCYQNIPALNLPCVRGAGSYEEVAGAEWDYFLGNGNPNPLREDQGYWKFDAWPMRFVLLDISKTRQPFQADGDNTLAGGYPDGDRYGAQQLADVKAVMNVDSFPFKCYAHEVGIDAGQPWADWHATEYAAWKTDFDGLDNLNGTAGNSWVCYGDNHSIHYISYNTFWAFSVGTIEDAPTDGASLVTKSLVDDGASLATKELVDDGALRQLISSFVETNNRRFGGFWVFEVHGTADPQYISARYIDGGTGHIILGPVYLEAGAEDNQWTYTPANVDYPRPRLAG